MSTTETAMAALERAQTQLAEAWQQKFLAQGAKLSAAFPKREVEIWASHGVVTLAVGKYALADMHGENWPKRVDDHGTRDFFTSLAEVDSQVNRNGTILEGTQATFLAGQQLTGNVQLTPALDPKAELEAYITSRVKEFRAERVPSRPDQFDPEFKGVHWQIWINEKITLFYSVGIGHYVRPTYNRADRPKVWALEQVILQITGNERAAREQLVIWDAKHIKPLLGEMCKVKDWFKFKMNPSAAVKILPPPAVDVLSSMALDADALTYSFPDWAAEFGYSSDSIKAKGIYDACQDIGFKLRSLGLDPWRVRELASEAGY